MPLEPASIQALTPRALPYKVFDGAGLYLFVTPAGGKLWRFKYRWAGKEGTMSFGAYPGVSLEAAREHRDVARDLLANGTNPSEHAKRDRAAHRDERARQLSTTRFLLDNDGALSFKLGARALTLSPAETRELREFLDATRAVTPKATSCP